MATATNIKISRNVSTLLENAAQGRGISVNAYLRRAIQTEQTFLTEDDVLRLGKEALEAYRKGETTSGIENLRRIAA